MSTAIFVCLVESKSRTDNANGTFIIITNKNKKVQKIAKIVCWAVLTNWNSNK